MGGSEKLAVHHGFPESGTASARGTANSQGARPAANSSLEPLLLLLLMPNEILKKTESRVLLSISE